MRFDILTLFPALFDSFLKESLIGKGLEKKSFEIRVIDMRDFTTDRHRTVDDRPFGGGPGMVLKPEPVASAIEFALKSGVSGGSRVILFSPAGTSLRQAKVEELARLDQLVLVCGRYEGVDARIKPLIDEEISVGDYVLTGGEVPAMAMVEAVARLLPGVLGKSESTDEETFSHGLLEYPQYTRPRVFRGEEVPATLLSGDHAAIRRWRLRESLKLTVERRPDLLKVDDLPAEGRKILLELQEESGENRLDFLGHED
jgi:tRNA (guanine37-N1)-methyltransferase